MPVTEVAFFTTTAGTITPAFRDVMESSLAVQDAWCNAHVPAMARGAAARGAALFQQVEDPAVVLLTAHWASAAQHGAWIASDDNARVYPGVKAHVDAGRTAYFHVDGVEALAAAEAGGRTPALDSPLVTVARCFVASGARGEFDSVYGGVRWIQDEIAAPFVSRGGWRVEKEEGVDREEYVMISGAESVEAMGEKAARHKDFGTYAQAMGTVMLGCDIKNYRRVL